MAQNLPTFFTGCEMKYPIRSLNIVELPLSYCKTVFYVRLQFLETRDCKTDPKQIQKICLHWTTLLNQKKSKINKIDKKKHIRTHENLPISAKLLSTSTTEIFNELLISSPAPLISRNTTKFHTPQRLRIQTTLSYFTNIFRCLMTRLFSQSSLLKEVHCEEDSFRTIIFLENLTRYWKALRICCVV